MKASAWRAARKSIAALVSAALVVSAFAPAVPALAAGNARASGAAAEVGRGGEVGSASLNRPGTAFTVPTLGPGSLTPSLALPSAPLLTPGAGAVAIAAPAAGILSAPAVSRPLSYSDAPEAAKAAAPTAFGRLLEAVTGRDALLRAPQEGPAADAKAKARAGAPFEGGAIRPDAAEPVAGKTSSAQPLGRWKRRAGTGVVATGLGGALLASHTDPVKATPVPSMAAAPEASGVLSALGQGGYWVGNALAFVFPLPEIYRAYKTGSAAKMPRWRAGVLIGANLALGLVNAPVAGMAFWGIQNLFGAAALLAVWPAARFARKRGADPDAKGFSKAAAAGTAVTTALALGLSAAVYFAAEAAVPGLLGAALTPDAVANLKLGIQVVTGGLYLLLFAPDLVDLARGQAPKGFTPGFSLAFMLSSVGFLAWTVMTALGAPWGSPEMIQFSLYAALNAVYAVTAGASWHLARKQAPRGPPEAAPSDRRDPPAAGPTFGAPNDAPAAGSAALARLLTAEARAKARAKGPGAGHARLISASLDLRAGAWSFVYHSPASGRIITVSPSGVETRRYTGRERPPMLRFEDLSSPETEKMLAAAALSRSARRFEVLPRATGGAVRRLSPAEARLPSGAAEVVPAPVPVEAPAAVVTPAAPSAADADLVEEYGPVHDEFPGLPRLGAPAPSAPAAATEPKLPRSWRRFPAEARETSPEALVAAKAEAQERARRIAPDARLVSVAINLEDPRSHWIFVFRSDKSLRELTVWTKSVGVKPLGFRPTKAPTLWDTRLGTLGGLDKAYVALKKAKSGFRPVRVEADPAWKGPAAWRFSDLQGNVVTVGADGKVVLPAKPLANVAGTAVPKSFESLPEDARGADGASLLALKADAEARARRLEPDARLVRVAINLDDPRSHWIFVFRSDKSRRELTVWTKSVQSKKLTPRQQRVKVPTLWDSRLEAASPVREAYAAFKAAKPSVKPIRLELTPAWKGDAAWHFLDGRGRSAAPVSAKSVPAEAPAPQVPGDRAPPETPNLPVPVPDNPSLPVPVPDQPNLPVPVPGKPNLPVPVPDRPNLPVPVPAPDLPRQPAPAPAPQQPAPVPAPQLPAPPVEPPTTPPADQPPVPPAPPAPPQTSPAPQGPTKWLHEDFLGFRWVKGLKRDAALGRLRADADSAAVIDQLSRQFGVPRERVLASGIKWGLSETGPLEKWLAVYDKLQAANRAQFERLDHKKYSGWRSFRDLANKTYPAGWKGALLRVSELHKHLIGAFVRLPYHLFDMFFFGYFRRAITFEFFRSGQDFLSVEKPDLAEKWFEAALKDVGNNGYGALGGLRAKTWYRGASHWLIVPLVKPMTTFVARRITLAIFSAIAMGILGAFAPVLPLSFALTSIPVLGPGLVALLNGMPVAVAAVPWLGPVLAPVFAAAITALVKDLVLGPLLNTLILASLLTFPRAMRERLTPIRELDPGADLPWLSREVVLTVLGTFVSWTFWRANLKSFFGLATVGAEIEGIMTYADKIDAGIDPVFQATLGVKPGIVHAVGAAIERPDTWTDKDGTVHHNLIPFGGAITWGNVLLYKLQEFVGFDISNSVMRTVVVTKSLAGFEGAADARLVGMPAALAVTAASERDGRKLPFDPDLWQKSPEEATARIAELMRQSGALDEEVKAVREHLAYLRGMLGDKEAQLAALKARSNPLTPAEREEYERLLRELDGKTQQDYVMSKLAQRRDLRNPAADDLAEIRRLRALQDRYKGQLVPPPDAPAGAADELALREASLRAMAVRLRDYADGKVSRDPLPPVDPETLGRIETLLGEIEGLRADVRGEMTSRDAAQRMLQAQARVRQLALKDRRDGSEMLGFHQNMARLATVMDLALSLNEINAAQAAIKQMLDLLEAKRKKIADSRRDNAADRARADANRAQIDQWRADIDKDILADEKTIRDLRDNEAKTGMVAQRAASFQADMAAFLTQLDAEDRGQSATAAAEYQRRLDLLSRVQDWRRNGNPNDPDAFSVKKFEDQLREIEDSIRLAEDGLNQIPTAPVEFAGILIPIIPGPEVRLTNPTRAQVLQLLADRRVHWQGRLADFQSNLDSVTRRLDPGNSRTVVDEFGDANPESLPRWRLQEQARLDAARAATAQYVAQMDLLAAQINRVAGARIPMLSGLSNKQMQDAVKTYGDALRAVNFPNGETVELTEAQMNLLSLAKLAPHVAREVIREAKAQATVEAIDDALTNVLPVAQQRLSAVTQMVRDILTDVDADVALLNAGGFGGQALIDRKTALLRDKILPPLRGAQSLLRDTLLPFQRKSIDQAAPTTSDLYRLYDAKLTLAKEARKVYDKTVPWALASFGAPEGDQAAARTKIADWRQRLTRNITGYDDAEGHHKGIAEHQAELANRKNPDYTGTEVLYGETQPFSLPRKISQYSAERTRMVAQFNANAAEINAIIDRIKATSGGRHDLTASKLPTGIGDDPAGVSRVQQLVDARAIPLLADRIKAVAEAAQAAGGSSELAIGSQGDGTVPVGTQPPITLSQNQQIALLALDAAKRLAPSSLQSGDQSSASYAMARILFSDAVISASRDALNNQIPAAEAFMSRATAAIDRALADAGRDEAYVNSNGTSETADQLLTRKAQSFGQLNALLVDALAFFNIKQGWNRDKFGTVDRVKQYYEGLSEIYTGGATANDNEVVALDKMRDALTKTFNDLEATRRKVSGWMAQLNDPRQSALRRVSESIAEIQEKTRAVLEANIKWHDLSDELKRSQDAIRATLTQIDSKQAELARILARPELQDALPAATVRRVENLRMGHGAYSIADPRNQAQALVVKKSDMTSFVDALLGIFTSGAQGLATRDVAALRADLLKDPRALASVIPDTAVMEFGDGADGFYLVYQSKFSVPAGLETSSWVTLGNVARVWGNNLSVTGYQFASPPNEVNAPYGDKGVAVQVESLQGRNWVNYLNVNLHRFALDIPATSDIRTGAETSRLMVFDDFAVMLMGDKLYVGLAGFADYALHNTGANPYYYGGNAKASLKLTEVMRLNVEQQELFAKDPRRFLQEVNLDFTGYDPDLNRTFRIEAAGENKRYSRTQVGPSFDINRLLNPEGGGDTFTVDLFYSRVTGTDDINQQAVGASVLKGFSIKRDDGKTWLRIDNRATGELGQRFNTFSDRLTFTFPEQGIAISGEGRIAGEARTYYAEISKQMGTHSRISVGYGSPYIGMNHRLSLSMNTSFTLGELWSAVLGNSAENLKGGETLRRFNRELDEFFKGDGRTTRAGAELERVFAQDVARKLVTQDIGVITREIQDLRKAGAFMDNSRVRGMVGFVTKPVSDDLAERAIGGGFTVGSYTEMTLNKTQKALLDSKIQTLYREGLRLQDRLLALTKDWQGAVVELAQAQWAVKMAAYEVQNAGNDALRREAEVRAAAADERLHQALLAYNALTGRDLQSGMPFQDLSVDDLNSLLVSIRRTIASPDRLREILGSLEPAELSASVGPDPFNLMDWLPWVDRLSVGFGVQFQDMMATQALTVGASFRLPVYDPRSEAADKAYVLESQAVVREMQQVYAERRLAAAGEAEQARLWAASAQAVTPNAPAAAKALGDAIRAYRNGLIGPDVLRRAFADWSWYANTALDAQSRALLAQARAAVDAPYLDRANPADTAPLRLGNLNEAFVVASRNSSTLAEVALRQAAAEEMARAQDNRIQKLWVDLNIGTGLTATGIGWIPSIGITGIPITPIVGFELKPEELRELQVRQGDQQSAYYQALKSRLEAGLAVQFYNNAVAFRSAETRMKLLEQERIPQLEAALAAAVGTPARTAAQRALDQARLDLENSRRVFAQARATLNFLLGRPPDSALALDFDETQALAALTAILAEKDPVGSQKRINAARVEIARAVETVADKDLKVEQLHLEPVSLVMRSLSRLLDAIGGETIGNPDLVAAARVQTLVEERAAEAYDAQRAAQASRLRVELDASLLRLRTLEGRTDPESRLEQNRLAAAVFAARAQLLSLGEVPDAPRRGALPGSWAELKSRLAAASQAAAAVPPEERVDMMGPETLRHRSAAFVRYYVAKQTLGHIPIDRNYVEGWVEVRLKDMNTPPEVLIALARLREEKAERLYRHALVGASARADILAAQFESDARLLRWIEHRGAGAGIGDPSRVAAELRARLEASRDELVALLGLSPETPLSSILALVPDEASPAADLRDLSGRLVADIRARQLDSIRRTLFDGGLPPALGNEDGLMQQIRADTIAERMSYKGFTPVAAFGVFRGRAIGSGFIEAPDPREIERGLENVMTDVLRKELQSSGRLQELSLRLHSLMSRVEDGAKRLEAQRRLIEAAESDLLARTAQANSAEGLAELRAAEQRLVDAWTAFARQMVETKSVFITLVTELEALGVGGSTLRPFVPPMKSEPRHTARPGTRDQLLDFWSQSYADPAFAGRSDALLARLSPGVSAEVRARIERAAQVYRVALVDASAVEHAALSPAERADLLMRNDKEGKRLELRAALEEAFRALGRLDSSASPTAELIALLRTHAEDSADKGRLERETALGVGRELRANYWRSLDLDPAVAGAFTRLEEKSRAADQARQALLAEYLTESGDDATRFVLRDVTLDAYLKAQKAFDDEFVLTLESEQVAASPAAVRALDGLYGAAQVLERAQARAKHGRGLDALDALIGLEESRLRAARWASRSPAEVDAAAEALQVLRQTRERWLNGKDDLQPVYALTRVGPDGLRTWTVDQWITAEDFDRLLKAGKDNPGAEGVIIERDGRWFVDRPATKQDADKQDRIPPGTRYEVIGGVDVAQARRDRSAADLTDNASARSLAERMKDSDFVAPGPAGQPAAGWSFAQVFGPEGLHRQGRVFFFEAAAAGPRGAQRALHPLDALSRKPEDVVMMVYGGSQPLRRDRFPTLASLKESEHDGDFRVMTVSPRGAAELIAHARRYAAAELRRGWLEVKLNSWGFARDENGRVTQLYRSRDDFEAQRKAYDNAAEDLAKARAALAAAKAELERRAEAEKQAKIDYDAKRVEASVFVKAAEEHRKARTAVINAENEVLGLPAERGDKQAASLRPGAEEILRRAGVWTLYRTDDLTLSVDATGAVVRAAASPSRGPSALDEVVPGGGPQTGVLTSLAAAVIDEDGRLRRAYAGDTAVDDATAGWTLKHLAPGGDRDVYDEQGHARMKVRYSHYEENVDGRSLPVTLGQRYLIEKMERTDSKLWRTKNWAIMPWQWGSLLLEVPRGAIGAPIELMTGRDPRQHHYLGRAYMYKTEGGTTERYGLFRSVVGFLDVFNFLPDPVGRAYDPSQFPDMVAAGPALRPGESLFDRSLRTTDDKQNVHLGALALKRMVRYAAEDLDAARARTLSRFAGGVETTIIETRRGRAGAYQESWVSAETGPGAVARRLEDPLIAADPRSDGRDQIVTSATPGHLLVDRVERRVRILPGAVGYDQQAAALDGYAERAAARALEADAARAAIEARLAAEEARLGERRAERDRVTGETRDALSSWHRLAWRVGAQLELERRIAALEADIAKLKARIQWWERYLERLAEARRNPGPVNPGDPRAPLPNGMFWVWAFIAALFAALAAAFWHWRRERRLSVA